MTNLKKNLLILCLAATTAQAQTIELPTMGWSSWNTFDSNISEQKIKEQADAMVSKGYKAVGYTYVNIDDGFQGGRNKDTGELLIHPQRFPNGLKVVSDYIHKKGLKAGIYSDGGKNTCANFHGGDVLSVGVGLYGYDERDCKFFFDELDFDFIKVDFCGGVSYHNSEGLNLDARERYTAISNAIKKCNKKDVRMNICRWDFPGTWAHDVATSWRTTGDINNSWGSVRDILRDNLYLSAYCYDGHYNDMDMLEVGVTKWGQKLSVEEAKTHFGMWCIMDSPLLIGCDMNTVDATSKALLQNKELIALNQDSLCLQAYVISKQGDCYVLAKDIEQLYGKTRAVALYNPTDAAQDITLTFGDADLGGNIKVRDLFTKKDLADQKGQMTVNVPAHGTKIYKLTAEKRFERDLYEAETAYLSRYSEIDWNVGRYEGNASASGGEMASYIGNSPDNDLRWRHVYSKKGGKYTMTVRYFSAENRRTLISVNGEKVLTQSLNSGGWGTAKEVKLNVTLKPGDNEVRIYTDGTNWLPNIDCMTLAGEDATEANEKKVEMLTCQLKEAKELPLTGSVKSEIESLLQTAEKEGISAEELAKLAADMQDALKTANAITRSCAEFNEWMENAQLNAEASEESAALSELKDKMLTAQTDFDAATSSSKVTSVLTTLKTALKNYLKSDEAKPQPEKTLDMTLLLSNPNFTATSGWNGSPAYSNGVGQCSNKNFNVYQSLTGMKPGVYEVSAQAFYRTTDNDAGKLYSARKEVIPARMYANLDSVPLPSLYKYKFSSTISAKYGENDTQSNYANSTVTAAVAFDSNRYPCSVTTTLNETGTLKIGFTTKTHDTNNWCCFDKVKIIYRSLPEEDGINTVEAEKKTDAAAPLYDLGGRKIQKATSGIYVRKGKKVVK
ncbi:MAG: alpha-galactosidase [Bacteroidales bacterium]|nr:alpha-galactosidase [Bacteroidales bacterium]